MKEDAQCLVGKFVVSCQAYEDNPLYGEENMVTMARCALGGGAEALRICWPGQVAAIRRITDVPIIGINKIIRDPEHFDIYNEVFITPTYDSAVAIIEAGCTVVALDGTLRGRRYEDLEAIVHALKKNYPHVPLMADIATIQEGMDCAKMGFDIVSSTLSGYTQETRYNGEAPDFTLISRLKRETGALVNGEGRIWTLDDMKKAMDSGADMLTVGSAITHPMKITEHFSTCFHSYRPAGEVQNESAL